jgi:hypothetical protein
MSRASLALRSTVLISVIGATLFGFSSVAQADPGADGDVLNARTAAALKAEREAEPKPAPTPPQTVFSIVVVGGDSFSKIVQKHCGRGDWENIPFPGRNKNLIRAGETITIDCSGAVPAANAPASINGTCGGATWNSWGNVQRGNAYTIVHVGLDRGVPYRGLVIALMTAMQESSLNNYGYLGDRNDHDSQGLFQQRPSMGWGTVAQVTDPVYAANKFYDVLLNVRNWQNMQLTLAAQAVQVSAYPYAYAKWEHDATVMVDNC